VLTGEDKNMKKIIGLFVCLLLIVAAVPAVISIRTNAITSTVLNTQQTSMTGNWAEIQKLLASDGEAGDMFSWSVSLSNDTALIGALDPVGNNIGSVYVFIRTESIWIQQAKLQATDGGVGDDFGFSVSLDGDTALIGAPGSDDMGIDSGSAYVFTRNVSTWTQQAKLLPSDGVAYDCFGEVVSIDDDTALISTTRDDNYKGAVYVFTYTGTIWTQKTKLLALDGAAEDQFGCSVDVDGDKALIGAGGDDDNGINSGSAYVFTRYGTTWTQEAKLHASDGAAYDEFGFVSLDGNTAVIGAPSKNDYIGAAYVFVWSDNNWIQQTKLLASDGNVGDYFGWTISVSNHTILIGAQYDDDLGVDSGAAYIFTRIGTSWMQKEKLYATDSTIEDYFGWPVSLSGNTALIGAPCNDDNGNNSGSAYIFKNDNQPPNTPTITGPAKGKIKVAIDYNFTTTDPDEEDLYYFIEWGDGTNSGWIGPYASGIVITKSHTWSIKGDYSIKVKAIDTSGAESGWEELTVTMPFSYDLPMQWFCKMLFERFPHAFPILRYLLGY
jgi:hypothetical protein